MPTYSDNRTLEPVFKLIKSGSSHFEVAQKNIP